ncbi:hypothetical protein NQD34_001271 [Periophthalmus magnuspinnatus]|nr:hypothetical protein NQD34_001271 [Periophthalmus magnuspinnatus]
MATAVLALMLMMGCILTETQLVPRGPGLKLRVRVNVTEDTIVFRFLPASSPGSGPDSGSGSRVRLEGHVVGYGSGSSAPQFIPLPQGGLSYVTELDAEPKYLLSVQGIPETDLHPHCTGKVDLQTPLRLVVRYVSPTAVLLSWAPHPHTPLGDILGHCLQDGFYTVRWRERSSKWQYEWCPTSDTVLSDLEPGSEYEFSVRATCRDHLSGDWSKPVYHSTNGNHKPPLKTFKLRNPLGRALSPRGRSLFPPRPALHNRTRLSLLNQGFNHRTGLGGPGGARPSIALNKRPNQVLNKDSESDKIQNLKDGDQLRLFKLKPKSTKSTTTTTTTTTTLATTTTTTTPEPTTTTTTQRPSRVSRVRARVQVTTPASRHQSWEESELFQPLPSSDLDAQGKKRYTAPHVVYQTGKRPDEPCSITSSLDYFPPDNNDEELGQSHTSTPPRAPPSNVTVVTVEGCPSFVILDWDKTNDTTEYEVISTSKGPDGEKVSVLTTNQTHTAVENLRPESSYEFKVKPKNDVGSGPESEPVEFSTESADPRVSETVAGKAAIWTEFPFAADSDSDCRGRQFVKRTWYRKFVGVQLCNSLRYKIYLSDSLHGKFFDIGDQSGFGEDHCQFVDSFLDGKTGRLRPEQLQEKTGFYRAMRQEPVYFGSIGGRSQVNYVSWYECGTPIPGKW